MTTRSRAYQRRERTNLALAALVLALTLVAAVFGLLAQTEINTGAALGYGTLAVMAAVVALTVIVEVITS